MPIDPPRQFADGIARTARDMVAEAKTVVVAAARKVDNLNDDPDAYTASDLIETTAQLLNVALKGGARLTEAALKLQPDPSKAFDPDAVSEVTAGIVDEVKQVATGAADSVQNDTYTVGGIVNNITKLGAIGITGGIKLAETSLQQYPDNRALLVVDQMATIMRRMVHQAAMVTEVASEKYDDNAYKPNDWVKSMLKLVDIAVMGGVEIAETALIGPARFARAPIESDPFDAKACAGQYERTLSLSTDLARPGTEHVVPGQCVHFLPGAQGETRSNELDKDQDAFRIAVDAAGMPSGVYEGVVAITRKGPAGEEVAVETVKVTIAL